MHSSLKKLFTTEEAASIIANKKIQPNSSLFAEKVIEHSSNPILERFVARLHATNLGSFRSPLHYEKIFDEEISKEKLKEAISSVDDFHYIFSQAKFESRKRYAFCSYFFSKFPIEKPNGHFSAWKCDDEFLKKIIHNEKDFDKLFQKGLPSSENGPETLSLEIATLAPLIIEQTNHTGHLNSAWENSL